MSIKAFGQLIGASTQEPAKVLTTLDFYLVLFNFILSILYSNITTQACTFGEHVVVFCLHYINNNNHY